MNWVPHLTVAAVAERDGRFLIVQEWVDGRLVINQPAGHVEDGEALTAAVVRETLEETAWDFQPRALVGFYRWRHPGTGESFFRVCFSGEALLHHPERALDPDISAAGWLSAEELIGQADRHRSPLVQRCLSDYLEGRRYPLQLLQDLPDVASL